MPRLSKFEKQQQNEVVRRQREAEQWAEFVASYPRRLLNLVYEYASRPELNVVRKYEEDSFVFSRPREMSARSFPADVSALVNEYDYNFIYALEDAEYQVKELFEAEREADRLHQLRQRALSKLSAEERAALRVS